jgi:hypothetical protein
MRSALFYICREASPMTKALLLLFSFLLLSLPLTAASQSNPAEAAFPEYRASAGRLDADGLPTSGAQLCLQKQPVCFDMPHLAAKGSPSVIYEFGLDPKVELVRVGGGGNLVLFAATYSGGGSGLLTRLSMLRYSAAKNALEDLLPETTVSEVSNYELWQIPEMSPYPLLVTANMYWDFGEQETHFDPHRFAIRVLTYDAKTGKYRQCLSYRTARKYNSEDPIVLKPEHAAILHRLKARMAR